MSTVLEPTSAPTTEAEAPFLLTSDIFTGMLEAGLFPDDARVFLREGRLYEKMAKSRFHGSVGAGVTMALVPRLPAGWSLWPEATLVLGLRNAPLPDFAVMRPCHRPGKADPERYPGPADVGLIIEVAVTSLRADLTASRTMYATAGIPIYWVIDVLGRRVVVHTDPRVVDGRSDYAQTTVHTAGAPIPLVLDGQQVGAIPFDEILG
jgi:Uma2 family endonuclease